MAPNFEKEFKLTADAIDTGAGSVLRQEASNGNFSKKINKHQRNYATVEKECLSPILSLQHFEINLNSSSAPITVFSDHYPLIFINKTKNKNQRLLRLSLFLQEYNLDIRHVNGKDNIIPDVLSRVSIVLLIDDCICNSFIMVNHSRDCFLITYLHNFKAKESFILKTFFSFRIEVFCRVINYINAFFLKCYLLS